ncbi:MAG TPA: membrane protein insertase YidC, partial [Gammaproteobacteria bacterium]|nr:membrane protein insertase YidC [Gammaproteobacteria bacterium]
MDNTRLVLFVALSLVVLMLWSAWQQDYGPASKHAAPPASSTAQTKTAPGAPATGGGAGTGSATSTSGVPSADLPPTGGAAPAAKPSKPAQATGARLLPSTGRIHVKTDVLDVTIDTT